MLLVFASGAFHGLVPLLGLLAEQQPQPQAVSLEAACSAFLVPLLMFLWLPGLFKLLLQGIVGPLLWWLAMMLCCSVPLGVLNAVCFLYQVQGRTVTLHPERVMCMASFLVSKILAKF